MSQKPMRRVGEPARLVPATTSGKNTSRKVKLLNSTGYAVRGIMPFHDTGYKSNRALTIPPGSIPITELARGGHLMTLRTNDVNGTPTMSRRRFLGTASALAGATALAPAVARAQTPTPALGEPRSVVTNPQRD